MKWDEDADPDDIDEDDKAAFEGLRKVQHLLVSPHDGSKRRHICRNYVHSWMQSWS